jgi:hypothetical protein
MPRRFGRISCSTRTSQGIGHGTRKPFNRRLDDPQLADKPSVWIERNRLEAGLKVAQGASHIPGSCFELGEPGV